MRRHLSAEEICAWVAGDGTGAAGEHLGECEQCRAEIARMEEALSVYRTAVRRWAEPPAGMAIRLHASAAPRVTPRWWMAAAAAVLLSVSVTGYRHTQERRRKAEEARADALLVEQVNAAVSRKVPPSMEPLLMLVSWEPGASERSRTK